MDPDFGVGLLRFLFENSPYGEISTAVERQVARYMPFLEIENMIFNKVEDPLTSETHAITLSIKFKIIPLDLTEILEITQFLD